LSIYCWIKWFEVK